MPFLRFRIVIYGCFAVLLSVLPGPMQAQEVGTSNSLAQIVVQRTRMQSNLPVAYTFAFLDEPETGAQRIIEVTSLGTGDSSSREYGGDQTGSSAEGERSFAPTTPTIWNVNPGQDQLVGTCGPDVKPINYCPSLLQLVPYGTDLLMKGMELKPYYLRRVRNNVYFYSGAAPAVLGRGTIKLTLVFTSEKTWGRPHVCCNCVISRPASMCIRSLARF